ncbi:PIG-L family deacetylase [bacterium]|nr:PIG-L family deacetylase [bacterium]
MAKEINYKRKKILTVLAHPDDESFGMGGTLALYAQKGVDVQLVCATRGELGDVDPEYKAVKNESAACLRTQELRCAVDALGINQLYFLNYRDSGMAGSEDNHHPKALAAQPVEQVAEEVAHLIRREKPDVVLTFDPIGGYRHPDHIAIQRATVRAFELAAARDFHDPEGLLPHRPEFLYFHTISKTFLKIAVWAMRLIGQDPHKFGRNNDIDLASLTEVEFPTHVKVNFRSVKDHKDQAARCHASQGGAQMNKGIRGFITRLFGGTNETFMQAYPSPGEGAKVKRDLFVEG